MSQSRRNKAAKHSALQRPVRDHVVVQRIHGCERLLGRFGIRHLHAEVFLQADDEFERVLKTTFVKFPLFDTIPT